MNYKKSRCGLSAAALFFYPFASFKDKEKAMDFIHRLHGASCLTRTGDTLINSQVL